MLGKKVGQKNLKINHKLVVNKKPSVYDFFNQL